MVLGTVQVMTTSSPPAAPRLPAGVRVRTVPGLPAGVEVRASRRRRRTVTAYREAGRTVLLVPERMSGPEILRFAAELLGRLDAPDRRVPRSDSDLLARAHALSADYLGGRAQPASVRWVTNQQRRWGSCTPLDGSIRLSDRLAPMPAYVVDYVLLHEVAHLLVANHGPAFDRLLTGYPRLVEAQAFLAGVDHALAVGAAPGPVVDLTGRAPRPEAVPTAVEPVAVRPDGTLW